MTRSITAVSSLTTQLPKSRRGGSKMRSVVVTCALSVKLTGRRWSGTLSCAVRSRQGFGWLSVSNMKHLNYVQIYLAVIRPLSISNLLPPPHLHGDLKDPFLRVHEEPRTLLHHPDPGLEQDCDGEGFPSLGEKEALMSNE